MPEILITKSIHKQLKKRPYLLRQLKIEIKKHLHGTQNLIDIYTPAPNLKVLKAYLNSNKVRAAILLKVSKKIYIPFLIVRKESKLGWNLSKYSERSFLKEFQK